MLRQCSKQLLQSWPQPPPPRCINYDLISFHFSDGNLYAWYGVSKSLSAALEAYLHFKNMEGIMGNGLREAAENTDYSEISIQFLQLGDDVSGHSEVPLLRFDKSEYYQDSKPAETHPDAEKFGAKTAGERLTTSMNRLKKMMKFDLSFLFDSEDVDENGDPKFKVDDRCKAAWLWLKDVRPLRDINGTSLVFGECGRLWGA